MLEKSTAAVLFQDIFGYVGLEPDKDAGTDSFALHFEGDTQVRGRLRRGRRRPVAHDASRAGVRGGGGPAGAGLAAFEFRHRGGRSFTRFRCRER